MEKESFSARLKLIIEALPPERVEVAYIRDLFGQEGLMLLSVFLTIPFMIPVSIPGVSTVFGVAILLIGISRLLGRQLWLPKRIVQRTLPADKLRSGLTQGMRVVQRLERLARPLRLKWLITGRVIGTLNSCSLITGALLLMAPFGFVPFSNTLPALALLLLSIGFLQRDGVYILLGHLVNVATILYFGLLIAGGSILIHEMLRYVPGR